MRYNQMNYAENQLHILNSYFVLIACAFIISNWPYGKDCSDERYNILFTKNRNKL